MKARSVLMLAAALMLPVGGVMIAKTGFAPASVAYADSFDGGNLLAQSPSPTQKPEGRMRRRGMGEQWGKELNLTSDQQAQIKTIREQEKSNSESLRQQMKIARERLSSLMTSGADDGQLRQQHDQIQQLSQQLGDRRFDTMLKIRNVLTPEQRTKAAQLMKEHKGRHGWGGHKGWGERKNQTDKTPSST